MFNKQYSAIFLTIFGAFAGLSFYGITEWLLVVRNFDTLSLAITVFSACFFSIALIMAGPISIWRSLLPAAGGGGFVTLLTLWANLRFVHAQDFIDTGLPIVAIFVLLVISIPFLIAAAGQHTSRRNYADLFDVAWNAVARLVFAPFFIMLFWLLFFLSDALFELVGIKLLSKLLEIDYLPYILSGAVFGLALNVVHEWSHTISAKLILRLLALLMPMVTVVVTIFVVALPFSSFSDLLNAWSAGGTLMVMGLVAITLTTVALERAPNEGVQWAWYKLFVQVLACLVPILGALAIAAVWIRVQEYGWTPPRLAAATVAAVVLMYGLSYAGAVILRGDWEQRLRQQNIVLAMAVFAVITLWFTPILNPEAISVKSQMMRLNVDDDFDQLPLEEMTHKWGKVGTAQIAALKERFEQSNNTAGLDAIAQAEAKDQRDRRSRQENDDIRMADLEKALTVYPDRSALPSDLFTTKGLSTEEIIDTCLLRDCVLIAVPQIGTQKAHFILFSNIDAPSTQMYVFTRETLKDTYIFPKTLTLSEQAKQNIRNGIYTIGPPNWSSVKIGGAELYLAPWQ